MMKSMQQLVEKVHWKTFTPITWKRGVLRTLIKRTYTIWFGDHSF